MRCSTLFVVGALLAGCVDAPELEAREEALTDSGILPDVPGTLNPSGYGNYCSVTDPSNGGWALWAVPSGDSCAQLAASVGPGSIVRRAGLWAIHDNNNVMVRCDGGVLHYGRTYGGGAIDWIFNRVTSAQKNCVFTVSPTKMPVWRSPFTDADTNAITDTSVFGFHLHQTGNATPWDVAQFGRVGTDACEVDRTGTRTRVCKTGATVNDPYAVPEAAYDWSLPFDRPLLAVADGVIRKSYGRPVTVGPGACANSPQAELFLETQVGSGQYAEHFIAAYHHMDLAPSTSNLEILLNVARWGGPMAPEGTVVKKGDVIAYVGSTGCSSGPHLDFMAFRLTNLTGARSYPFEATTESDAGVNGFQGVFDPFGWAAPQGVDPLAYKFIGFKDPFKPPPNVTDIGTFSVNLWQDDFTFEDLPHNGGASW